MCVVAEFGIWATRRRGLGRARARTVNRPKKGMVRMGDACLGTALAPAAAQRSRSSPLHPNSCRAAVMSSAAVQGRRPINHTHTPHHHRPPSSRHDETPQPEDEIAATLLDVEQVASDRQSYTHTHSYPLSFSFPLVHQGHAYNGRAAAPGPGLGPGERRPA